ncbi:MAG TPA: DUF1501 domain-containing protein [Caldimonas sp.]|jgi:uncharacterized protein (DUF1501 family)|nr:DUF1501 domain-containing protein [Caldimonas sp.]HEX2542473.1 DUF1501 domain-containing protein [Caldimonas sp.]
MSQLNASRRKFLRTASVVSGSVGAAAAPFALNMASLSTAAAQTASTDYKAIICMFFYGGNDSSHMVLRTDTASFSEYTRLRNTAPESIALLAPGTPVNNNATRASPARLGGVLPIVPKFTASPENAAFTYGLHPVMTEVQTLFGAGRLAILANAGPLVVPLTRQEFTSNSKPRPLALGSHNDQQSTWQALGPEGAKIGWGGRLGDLMASNNSNVTFTSISVSGNAVFSAGETVFQYQVGNGGSTAIGGLSGTLFNSMTAATTLRGIVMADNQHLFSKEYAQIIKRSVDAQAAFQTAFAASTALVPTTYIQPSTGNAQQNGLAQQLQTVVRVIGARNAIGTRRQVFFVSMGGFDTHDGQNMNQADLLARISHAIGYLDAALANVNGVDLRNNVTMFTASDFGRTITSNGDGTDHGWGASHFVVGGAVNGGEIYGRFPQFGLNNNMDSANNAYLPNTSVDSVGSTIGKWFGASDTNLDTVFPNLRNFPRDLGFLKAG